MKNPVVSSSLWNMFSIEMLTYNILRFSIVLHNLKWLAKLQFRHNTRQIFYDLDCIAFVAIFQFRCCHMILSFES